MVSGKKLKVVGAFERSFFLTEILHGIKQRKPANKNEEILLTEQRISAKSIMFI